METLTDEQAQDLMKLAVRSSPLAWMESYTKIRDKERKSVHFQGNKLQREVTDIYTYCREMGIPCRLIGLKPRQSGLSTVSTGLLTHHLSNFVAKACIIGDEYEKSVKNLVQMVEHYREHDEFDWDNTFRKPSKTWSHGSELVTETANDNRAGASGTFQFLLGTEVAHWPETESRSASEVFSAILSCVPDLPNTAVIVESTPNGPSGIFYDTYMGAVTFEEFKAGKRGNGFIKVFYAWFEHPEYCVHDLTPLEARVVMERLSEREEKMVEDFGLTAGHVEWMRRKIAHPAFNGDEKKFDREYPSDPLTCFLTSGRPRFDLDQLKILEERAKGVTPEYCVIEGKQGERGIRRTNEIEGWLHVWERPKVGCKYLLVVDPATGASQTGGKNPDSHSALVLRKGYFDAVTGKWVSPKVAARLYPDAKVDITPLGEFVVKIAEFYGNCLVVVEVNNSGLALLEAIKSDSINLYCRELFNKRENKTTEALGWHTSDNAGKNGTRSIAVSNLADALRDEDIDLLCLHAIGECKTFTIGDDGIARASGSNHDDDVLALAIGITLLDRATTYKMQVRQRVLPKDLRDLERSRQNGSGTYR